MNKRARNLLVLAWLVAAAAMTGSLVFSNILHFPPCVLCWYQRIALYPLVVIIGVAILKRDRLVPYYVLPLTIIGGLIAVYHNLLYYRILPNSAAPCAQGISCTTQFIEWFGFVTIPFLSLLTFITITVLTLIYQRLSRQS